MHLRELQEQAGRRLMANNLIHALQARSVSRSQYVAYMTDVYSYARHSSQVIGLAGSRLVLSHPELAAYLFRHAGEELGHDQWAASDLRDLGVSDAELSRLEPSSPCLRMIALEYFSATHANPVGLFGWMFVLESLGGKVGGSIAGAIDGALQLQGRATRFLRGHAEADAHHSEDLVAVIAAHVRSDDDERAFLRMAAQSLDLYTAILDAAAGVPLAA